jgi:hypothetical protein
MWRHLPVVAIAALVFVAGCGESTHGASAQAVPRTVSRPAPCASMPYPHDLQQKYRMTSDCWELGVQVGSAQPDLLGIALLGRDIDGVPALVVVLKGQVGGDFYRDPSAQGTNPEITKFSQSAVCLMLGKTPQAFDLRTRAFLGSPQSMKVC